MSLLFFDSFTQNSSGLSGDVSSTSTWLSSLHVRKGIEGMLAGQLDVLSSEIYLRKKFIGIVSPSADLQAQIVRGVALSGLINPFAYTTDTRLRVEKGLAGTLAGSATLLPAEIYRLLVLRGTLVGTATTEGGLGLSKNLNATVSSTGHLFGLLRLARNLESVLSAQGNFSGDPKALLTLKGLLSSVSGQEGSLSLNKAMRSTLASTTFVSGDLRLSRTLAGQQVDGVSSYDQNILVRKFMGGNLDGLSAWLPLTQTRGLVLRGQIAVLAELESGLALAKNLLGTVLGSSEGQTRLSVAKSLSGTMDVQSALLADLKLRKFFADAIVTSSEVSGRLVLRLKLGGSFDGQAFVAPWDNPWWTPGRVVHLPSEMFAVVGKSTILEVEVVSSYGASGVESLSLLVDEVTGPSTIYLKGEARSYLLSMVASLSLQDEVEIL